MPDVTELVETPSEEYSIRIYDQSETIWSRVVSKLSISYTRIAEKYMYLLRITAEDNNFISEVIKIIFTIINPVSVEIKSADNITILSLDNVYLFDPNTYINNSFKEINFGLVRAD
jgi:hypothetical protein